MRTDRKSRNNTAIAVLLLVFIIIVVAANIKYREGTWLESAAISLFSPVQKVMMQSFRSTRDVISKYFFLVGLKDQVAKLEDDNAELMFENNLQKEIILKYQRIETLFSIKKSFTKYNLLLANVVGYDPSNWSRMIVIDKGMDNSIKKNMAVITHKGLVGRVVKVMRGHAKVLLVTDARSSIDAVVQTTRDRAVVVGTNENYFTLEYLSINSGVEVGDSIVSSGMGGTVQGGLMIGRVRKIFKDGNGLFKRVEVTPSSDLDRLEEVFVVGESLVSTD